VIGVHKLVIASDVKTFVPVAQLTIACEIMEKRRIVIKITG